MKSFNLIVRRTHLYLGMLLIPWLLVYGISTLIFNHREAGHHGGTPWERIWEKPHTLKQVPNAGNLREVAAGVLAAHDLRGPFGAQLQGRRLNINLQNFRAPMRLVLDLDAGLLRAERKAFAWSELLARLHFRTGYNGGGLALVWPVIVDLFCVTMLVWIVTGLILWWKIRDSRRTGWLALGAGGLTFAGLLLLL